MGSAIPLLPTLLGMRRPRLRQKEVSQSILFLEQPVDLARQGSLLIFIIDHWYTRMSLRKVFCAHDSLLQGVYGHSSGILLT